MVLSSTQTSPLKRGGDPLDIQLKRLREGAFGQHSPANTSVLAGLGCLGALLALWRRILTHIDNVLDAVIDVPLTCLQGGGMRLADDGHDLSEPRQWPRVLDQPRTAAIVLS